MAECKYHRLTHKDRLHTLLFYLTNVIYGHPMGGRNSVLSRVCSKLTLFEYKSMVQNTHRIHIERLAVLSRLKIYHMYARNPCIIYVRNTQAQENISNV